MVWKAHVVWNDGIESRARDRTSPALGVSSGSRRAETDCEEQDSAEYARLPEDGDEQWHDAQHQERGQNADAQWDHQAHRERLRS